MEGTGNTDKDYESNNDWSHTDIYTEAEGSEIEEAYEKGLEMHPKRSKHYILLINVLKLFLFYFSLQTFVPRVVLLILLLDRAQLATSKCKFFQCFCFLFPLEFSLSL